MKKGNRLLLFIALLALVFAGCSERAELPTVPEGAQYSTQGVSGSFATFYNQPPNTKNIDYEVVKFIRTATASVDIAIFNINRQSIIDELIARKQAGVNVRMVTESDYYNKDSWYPFYQQLESAGIPIVPDIGTALMHNKFIVVDGLRVLSGTYNFTDDQTENDKNMIIKIESSALADLYTQEFNQMFVDKKFHGQKTHITGTVYVDGCRIDVYFSPKVGAIDAMEAAINSANSNIWFDIFTFTHDDISASMISRYNAGVSVKGTFDKWQAGSRYSEYLPMLNAGIPVKRDTYSGFLHEKIMAIDAYTSSDPIGIIGSFNWTASADSSNDENLLIIHSSFVANSIRGQCVYVYNNWAE